MTDQNRAPKGIPAGGQFAADTRSEASVSLAPSNGATYRSQLAGNWSDFTSARDAMAQSAMESLAASLDREFGEGTTVLLEVDPVQPTWMRLSGVRQPNGARINNGLYQGWKYDDDFDLSPVEAAEYLPADTGAPWWANAVQVKTTDKGYIGERTGTEEWHLDISKVRAAKVAAA